MRSTDGGGASPRSRAETDSAGEQEEQEVSVRKVCKGGPKISRQ